LGQNYGTQPGQPYVLEIWPPKHSSPIHNHGDALAIIKILYGKIKSEVFNPLSETNNQIDPKPIKEFELKPDDITWMTPFHYQTHRLTNESSESTAVTIQAYAHTGNVYSEFDEDEDPEKDSLKNLWIELS
jgi:predicted metal-dependent enzyme (double-stranded beta helix superfamily)